MMPAIKDRTDDWRHHTYEQGDRCRQLWARVVLNAVLDSANEVSSYRRKGKHALADQVIETFRRWAVGRDGREVMRNAGIQWEPRVVEILTAHVAKGEFSISSDRRRNHAA